ncbi:valine--tRNA ligase, partial [Salibacteraceae bacterium]|nr:valine--tRNA ligase [Salibacteraceae bacterium]
MISNFELSQSIITEVRSLRASKNLSPREGLVLMQNGEKGAYAQFESIISKLANVQLEYATQPDGPAASFIIGTTEFAVPLEGLVDSAEEKTKLKEELKYQQGFMNSVSKKLANERFVSNAPEAVVASERKKMADAESRIKSIQEAIAKL